MNAMKIKSLHSEAKGGIFVGDDFPALRLAQADLLSRPQWAENQNSFLLLWSSKLLHQSAP